MRIYQSIDGERYYTEKALRNLLREEVRKDTYEYYEDIFKDKLFENISVMDFISLSRDTQQEFVNKAIEETVTEIIDIDFEAIEVFTDEEEED